MFLKLLNKECFSPKLGHLTMQAQRYGEINPMILKAIFGPWVAFCMKC